MQIIGLAGAAGSGKSEAAKIIASCYPDGAVRVLPFAKPIKRLCRDAFDWDSCKDGPGRTLLQTIGMAGRAYNPRIWVDKWLHIVGRLECFNKLCIIADDVRFENECEAVRDLGGTVWQIERPGLITDGEVRHVSERDALVSLIRDVTKLDTSQDCDPINHGLVVRAMDWLDNNITHPSERPLPARCIDATIRNDGSIEKLHYIVLERTLRLMKGGTE